MATALTLLACGVLVVVAVLRRRGASATLVGIVILSVALFPAAENRGLFGLNVMHIAVCAVGIIAALSFDKKIVPWAFGVLAVYVVVCVEFAWGGTESHWRGALSLFGAILAWTSGAFLGRRSINRIDIDRFVCALILGIAIVEAGVSVLQTAGFPVFTTSGRTADLTGGRSNGTFEHPAVVGKVLLILMTLLLPLSRSTDSRTRRMASWAIVVSIIPIFLSGSRANIAAVLLVVVLWSLFAPRDEPLRKRVAVPLVGLALCLTFFEQIMARFAADPEGATRQHFNEVAVEQFLRSPFVGVGPNSYVPIVGRFDLLTAQGWPVHNIYLLQLVELGLIGAILFFIPVFYTFFRAIARLPGRAEDSDVARAIVITTIAIAGPVANTGWGLLSDHVLYLWFFVIAYSGNRLRSRTGSLTNVPAPIFRYSEGTLHR